MEYGAALFLHILYVKVTTASLCLYLSPLCIFLQCPLEDVKSDDITFNPLCSRAVAFIADTLLCLKNPTKC